MKISNGTASKLALVLLTQFSPGWDANAAPLSFANDIQPILEKSCLPCHNATKSEGGLILETPREMLAGGESGAAIRPNHGLESLLYQTSARMKKPFMPPEANKAKAPALDSNQLELLRRWIDEGAIGNPKPKEPVAWGEMPKAVKQVVAVAVAEDGLFAAAARGNEVSIYDLLLKHEVVRLKPHADVVSALAFSPDGRLFASGGCGEIKVWRKRASVRRDVPKAFVVGKAFSPDGKFAAEASVEEGLRIKKAEGGAEVTRCNTDRALLRALASADLALAGAKFEVAFLESELKAVEERLAKTEADLVKSEKELSVLKPKKTDMSKALVETTAKREASMSARDQADDALTSATLALEVADKNKASAEAALKAANLERQKAAPDQKDAALKLVEVAQADVAKADAEQKMATANLKSAKDERAAKQKELEDATKTMSEAATAVSNTNTIERNTKAFTEVIAQSKVEKKERSEALEVAKAILLKSEAARTEASRASAEWKLPATEAVAFSGDGAVLFSRHAGGQIRAWAAATGMPLSSEDFASDWELAFKIGDASRVDSPLSHRVNALAFSPDGKLLASGSGDPSRNGELKLWNADDGTLVRELPKAHKDAVLALDFSLDGKFLASGSADRAVRVWETQSGKLFRNLEAHANHVLSVSLRGDARRVASASADNTVKTWDIQRSDVVATFSNFTKEVNFVRYLARGSDLFVTSASPAVRILQDSGTSELKGSKIVFAGVEARANTEGFQKFITAAAASQDGRTQVVGDSAGVVRLLSPEGKIVAEWLP